MIKLSFIDKHLVKREREQRKKRVIFSAHERWLPDSRGVVKRSKTSSPTSVKSESRTHSRVGRFDEHRRENIRTLHRRVEHPHPRRYIANAHYLHNNPQHVSRRRESGNVTQDGWRNTGEGEAWLSVALNCGKLESKFGI